MGSLFRMALLVAAIGCVAGCKNDGKKWNRGLKEISLPTAPTLDSAPTASSSPEKAGGTVGEPAPVENKPLPPPNSENPWGY